MRIGLIADIQANQVALEAVLAALAAEAIDRIVCLGDVAATGPQPREVVARLRDLGCPVVMGNADAWVLDPPPGGAAEETEAGRIEAIDRWCAAQLSADDLAYLRAFPPTLALPLGDGAGELHCCHGSPRSFDDVIAATTPDEDLDRMLAGTRAAIVAGGHSHVQLVRRHRDRFVLNPGSVGLPVNRLPPAAPVRNAPWAEYAIVTADGGRLGLELRRVPVDVSSAWSAPR